MAFNLQPASGPFFLAPGESMRCWVRLDYFIDPDGAQIGRDLGAQWIMAHPLETADKQPVALIVSELTKSIDYAFFNTKGEGLFNPDYQYWVTVKNTGQSAVFFSLQGGGVL